MRHILWLGILAIFLVGCSALGNQGSAPNSAGRGMGMGSGMMERHHAQIPQEYAGLSNPIPASEESYARGGSAYATHCASCHGDGGMGDGPAGAALNPAPAAIAHTSQMMSDDYLFWRISDGSGVFNTSMPAWKATLDEQTRWDVVNYVRALGKGETKPASEMGGELFDPELQAQHQAEILAQAVAQKVITQAEADIFLIVHTALEQYRSDHPDFAKGASSATEREAAILAELVKAQTISQEQADAFTGIHDRLAASGLMP